ncbi:MAG: endonuclease, partial [Dokdonella sp.]
AVTDLDGTADAMAADAVVTFSTLDPNAPPSLVSIIPADGATNVPTAADIRVVFSEAVTTTTGAFALVCDSTSIVLGESGTGANRTLTPAIVLPGGATCVFTITGSAVQNGNAIALASNPTSTFTVFAPTPIGAYYNGVDTSTPERLMCTLHVKIRGHTAYPYSNSGATDSWKILELADAAPSDPNKVLDVYRNRLYNAVTDRASGAGGSNTYNREHTWPNSLGFPGQTGNLGLPSAPYTDTHMLHISDTGYNSMRSNSPYKTCAVQASCAEAVTEVNAGFGGGSGLYPGNSNWSTNSSYEVWGHQKGDMARAVMYMAVRYQGGVDPTSGQDEPILRLTDNTSLIVGQNNYNTAAYMGVMADLLAWSQADPPDAAEIARNGVIQSFQGNRNPFIDHPEWATATLFNATYIAPAGCPLLSVDAIFANGFDSTAPVTIH